MEQVNKVKRATEFDNTLGLNNVHTERQHIHKSKKKMQFNAFTLNIKEIVPMFLTFYEYNLKCIIHENKTANRWGTYTGFILVRPVYINVNKVGFT